MNRKKNYPIYFFSIIILLKLYKIVNKYKVTSNYNINESYNYKFVIPFTKTSSKILNIFNKKVKLKNIFQKKIFFKSNKLTTKATLYFKTKKKQGCIIYFHGGGFTLKGSKKSLLKALEVSTKTNNKLLTLDYALAPKYKYPTQINQCMDLLNYIYSNHNKLGIDINNIVIMGDSAGGNLAFITAYNLMKKEITIKLLILVYPLISFDINTKSALEFSNTPILNTNSLHEIFNMYFDNNKDYEYDIDKLNLKKFPKTYIEVAQYDPLKDDGYILYDKLKKLNKDVELNLIENITHGYDGLEHTDITKKCIVNRIKKIKEVMGEL